MVTAHMNKLDVAALSLAVVGALNWGSVGLFRKDLVAGALGKGTALSRAVYGLVGIAGAYGLLSAAKAVKDARAAA